MYLLIIVERSHEHARLFVDRHICRLETRQCNLHVWVVLLAGRSTLCRAYYLRQAVEQHARVCVSMYLCGVTLLVINLVARLGLQFSTDSCGIFDGQNSDSISAKIAGHELKYVHVDTSTQTPTHTHKPGRNFRVICKVASLT